MTSWTRWMDLKGEQLIVYSLYQLKCTYYNLHINYRNTKTYIWNIEDLDNPVLVTTHYSAETATDHNQYIDGDFVS